MTRLLLEAGADVNTTKNNNNDTPLIIALKQQNIKIASYMLENGIKYGLDTSTKNSQRLPVRFYCWLTQNQAVIDRYEHFESENKTEFNENGDWITGADLLDAFQEGKIELAQRLLAICKDNNNIIDTSVTDKNGQTPWVYCWKSRNISLIMEYIEYHQKENIKWNIIEMDCTKTNNALICLFSKMIPNGINSQDISLLELLINYFLQELLLCAQSNVLFPWPVRHPASMLQLLFLPWDVQMENKYTTGNKE